MRCSQAWVTSPLGAADARRSSGCPFLAFLLLGVVIVGTTSLPRLAATLFDPAVLWGLLALQLAFLIWRLLAVGTSLGIRLADTRSG